MAQLAITKSVPAVTERLVRGSMPINSTPLLSLTALPVTGLYLVSFTCDLAALTNTVTVQLQEFTVTAAGDAVTIAVGDLFIPFSPAIGTGAGLLDATVTLAPSVSVTAHKIAVNVVNLTAAATNPASLTLKGLIIKAS